MSVEDGLKGASDSALNRPAILGYTVAVLAVALAIVALAMMQSRWQTAPQLSILLIAVVITTRLAGAKPGVLAAALAIAAFVYFIVQQPADPVIDIARLFTLAVVSWYVLWITATERARSDSLRGALDVIESTHAALRAENQERRRTEEELRASEATFRTLAHNAPAAIFICQAGNVRYANPRASTITGYSTVELCERRLADNAAPESRDMLLAREAARTSGAALPPHFELKILTKAGEERWLDFTEAPFEFEGKPAELSIALDVTERKRAEEALRKSERVLREAEKLGHTGSWEHDLVKGMIFNTPENVRLFFGDDASKGARFEDFVDAVHPDDRAYGKAQHEKLLSEGRPINLEFRVIWPDGTVRMLLGRAAVVRDDSGRIIRAYGTNVDVTERKRAEVAVREGQHLLNLVLETLPAGVAVLDRAGDVILSNAASRRIWGEQLIQSGAERWVRSQGYWHVSGQRIGATDWPSVRALRDGNSTLNELIDIDAFDGQRKTIETSAAPIRNADGSIAGAVLVLAEVTDRVRAEEALHDSAARLQQLSRRLLAVQEEERRHLSRELHDEFGQLLFSIKLHLQAAKSAAGPAAEPSLNESIDLLQRAGAQMRSLALELRPMLLETAGLDATLRWLAEQYQQRTGVDIAVVGHVGDVPGEVAIASFRVVQEALTNVVRHAAAQRAWIELSHNEGLLGLVIRDDGVGFDVSRLEGAAGDHLGLVGMRERVEILGGSLTLDARPGRGTRIEVSFPLDG